MPVIQARNGTVIAWSGIIEGPIQDHEPMGQQSRWVRYEAEVGSGAPETARVTVRVDRTWRRAPGVVLGTDPDERQIVSKYIEDRVADTRKEPLEPGARNNFSIHADEMVDRWKSLRKTT